MQHRRIEYRLALVALAVVTGFASAASAAVFSPVAQSRVVRAASHWRVVGYTCLAGGGGPPLPGCPELLEDLTTSDTQPSLGFLIDPFVAFPFVDAAVASHTSSIQPSAVSISGTGTSTGVAAELAPPSGTLLVLETRDRSTRDDSTITVDLDEPTPFVFQADGRIEYPDPAFPLSWDVEVQIVLEGPAGTVSSLSIVPDFGCSDPDPETFTCAVEPSPVVLTGTLPAGQYTLQVLATTEGNGSWLPSTGPLGGTASAEYAAALTLIPPTPVPGLGAVALTGLAAGLIATTFRLNSARLRSE